MAVNREHLERHLKDYAEVAGRATDRFVCPITLHECSEDELVDGHILNKKLHEASRKTVVQYGRVDHFFGSRVEPAVVRFWNEFSCTNDTPFKHEQPFQVRFENGTTVKAFAADASGFANASPHLTKLQIPSENGPVRVLVELPKSDPRWSSGWKIGFQSRFRHFDWVAAMLKTGFLAWFDMIGYRAVFDPFGDAVRSTLARYYHDNAKPNDVDHYFGEFRNAVKVLGTPTDPVDNGTRLAPLRFDTLEDRVVLFHNSGTTVIASTCIFSINKASVAVTLPLGVSDSDAGTVWKLYARLMQGDNDLVQSVHRARYRVTSWEVEETPSPLVYPAETERFYGGQPPELPCEFSASATI